MFKELLINQYIKKPKATTQDYIKLIYQSTFGGEHMVADIEKTYHYLLKEINEMKKDIIFFEPLYEYISNEYVRVNLRPYYKGKFSLEELNNAFSSQKANNNVETLVSRLKIFISTIKENEINLNLDEVTCFIKNYKENNFPVFHHTDEYRENYFPNYRVVPSSFISEEMRNYQLISFLESIYNENILTIVAIEGKCTSGKSTIADNLLNNFNATIIHADDFFLSQEQKEKEIGIGEYIDYERIIDLLKKISLGNSVTHEKYSCSLKKYLKFEINNVKPLVILEGVYSYNQHIRKYIDYLIYVNIDEAIQIKRLRNRSNDFIFNRFINEWIPRENEYFSKGQVVRNNNIVL